jgi:hypothetical protein
LAVEIDELLETPLARFQRYYRVTILAVTNAFPAFSLHWYPKSVRLDNVAFYSGPRLSAKERHNHSPKGGGSVFETLRRWVREARQA